MTNPDLAEIAEGIDALVMALIDRGVISDDDLPERLMQALSRRRLLMQKLGMTEPATDPANP